MKRVIAVFCLIVSLSVSAQELLSPVRSDLIPPSPSSAAMIEAEMPRPSVLTGAAAFSIPLHTIEVDGLAIPVTLQYQSNGVKVFDQSAPLGLGWSLTPALRASRTIMGRPDEEYEFKEVGDFLGGMEPWYTAFQCMANSRALTLDTDVLYDSQHDIFTFAIPGKTITRVIDARSKPYKFLGVDDDEYLVQSDDELNEITVTGPDGTVYIFGAPYEYQTTDDAMPQFRTGWALNKINLTSGRSIDLKWSNNLGYGPRMTYLGGASYIDNRDLYDFYGYENTDDFRNSSVASGVLSYSLPDDKMLLLESISYPGGKVQFTYKGTGGFFLGSVIISNDDTELRKIDLTYKQTGYAHWVLTEVDTGNDSPYVFDYYSVGNGVWNPHAQDWWGYYNAIENSTLEPRLCMHEQSPHRDESARVYTLYIGEADRSINEEAMKADILKSVRYPTGAVAEFEYETHHFEKMRMENNKNISPEYDVYLDHGGGLRVKTVTMRNGDADTSPQIIRYEYPLARVRAVPSASTFVNVSGAIMPKGLWGSLSARYYCPVRLVNVIPVSDYMRYDMGETPLWYDHVTEIHDEGKVEYHFRDMISLPNSFYDRFGIRMISNLSKVFSTGPQLVEKNIYKGTAGNYEKVESERNTYRTYYYGAISSTHINREMIMMGTNSGVEPDFDEGHIMRGAGPYGTTPDILMDYHGDNQFPYSAIGYGVERQTERLIATETVTYHNGDSIVVRKQISYSPRSSIVAGTVESCGDDVRSLSYVFAPDAEGPVAEGMAGSHIVNVPLRASSSRGGAILRSEAEYMPLGGALYRPRRIKTWYEGLTDTIVSPVYEYLGHRLAGFTDADGVSSAYLWGYNGNLPVVRIDGLDFRQAQSVYGSIASGGHAENHEFTSSAGLLYTKATYMPGVGITSLTQPTGVVERYGYDADGRLIKTSVDGLGTVSTYAYRINHDGDNSVTSYRWLDSSGSDKHTTAVYYDYRGRQVESKDFSGGGTREIITLSGRQSCSALSVFSEYDTMGRLSRTSVPSSSKPADAVSWTDMAYEPSPRGVKTAETRPGEEWKSGARAATATRAVNTAVMPWSCPRFELTSDGGVDYKGLWPAGVLTVTESIDEDGHAVYEASDFEGRKLMRREGAGDDWLSTYYIYDSFGRLRRVLQPILEVKSYDSDDADLEDYSFEYRYDGAGRCIYDRIPGSVPTLRRYSAAGRLVAEHLPAMADGEWRVFFYDSTGRKVLEGIAPFTDASLESFVAGSHLVSFSPINTATLCLRHADGFPDEFQPVAASYYDDYGYLRLSGLDLGFKAVAGFAATRSADVWGLPTGSVDLGDDGEFRYEAYYYDGLGRMIQSRSHAPEGDVIRSMRHDYTGAVEDERITVFRPDTTLTFATHTEYDQGERPYRITYRFENDSVRVKHTHNDEGRLSRTDFGINLARRYEYDIHGWPVRTETLLPFRQIVSPGDLQLGQRYYSDIVRRDTLPLIIRPPLEILSVNYTERMHYADGAFPRYTGEMSGRTTTFGSRYDYRYDVHDRLIGADYTAASTDSVGEDFSVSYTYDAIGRPLTLRRYGVLGIDGGEESFGLLDGLSYSYVGALPSSITRETEATEFYGRTGAVATEFDFNEAGLLTQDSGRSLINVNYNRNGLPIFTEVKPRRNMIVARSDIEENTYSSTGKLISTRHYRNNRNVKQLLDKKTLLANFTFASGNNGVDTLMRVDFPGGYFDNAGVHWMLTDAIGSIEMVVDGKGRVEQHTGYYPYGEPWREPAGQPYLFGGKERRRFASLGDSDFHARFLTTSTALWQAPDVHAGNYPWLSPWVFCNANPIKYVDPTGMDTYVISPWGSVSERIKNDEYDSLIMLFGASEKESPRLPSGTILEQKVEPIGDGKDCTYLTVNGDDNGTTLFQFLADNSEVEYSQLKCTTDEISELNYIGTSRKNDNEQAAGILIDNQLKKDGTIIREYVHSHPSGLLWPSAGDIAHVKGVKKEMNQSNIICKVYTTQTYEGVGNYMKFDERSLLMTPDFFRLNFKPMEK